MPFPFPTFVLLLGWLTCAQMLWAETKTIVEGATPFSQEATAEDEIEFLEAHGVTPAPVMADDMQAELARPEADEKKLKALRDALQQDGMRLRPEGKLKRRHELSSESRRFSVSGDDMLRVGAIAMRADTIAASLDKMLELKGDSRYPISIEISGEHMDSRRKNQMSMSVDLIGGSAVLRLVIHAGGGIDLNELTRSISSIILYEYALRTVDLDGVDRKLELPYWLISGIGQAVLWREGKLDSRMYQNLFERSEFLSPNQIIAFKRPWDMDAATRQLYNATCSVVVLGLLNQASGPTSLSGLLSEAILDEREPEEMIRRHFHSLGVDNSALSKWWVLQLANLSSPKMTHVHSPMETEKRLVEALSINYLNPESGLPTQLSFDDVYSFVKLPQWRRATGMLAKRLGDLSNRCFPSYRAFILEYIRAMNLLLASGDPDDVQSVLGPLRELREAYLTTSIRARDYLDWYEITHAGTTKKSSFNAYLDAMEMLRGRQDAVSTPMSRYLRDVEALYQLEAEAKLPARMRGLPREK